VLGLLAGAGAGGAGALGYAYGRTGGGWAVAVVFLVVAYWLVLLRQAMWLEVEEPHWRPRRS
jgi:ABC-type methionine transport system permease subunit